jgi:hypothetical protein
VGVPVRTHEGHKIDPLATYIADEIRDDREARHDLEGRSSLRASAHGSKQQHQQGKKSDRDHGFSRRLDFTSKARCLTGIINLQPFRCHQ